MACIYVVDDEKDLTWSMEQGLSYEGHQVVAVNDGFEALRMMHRRRPDLVVLDILMPGMDGLQVCQRLRSDPVLSTVPILFLTCKEAVRDKVDGFDAGCDDYLTKPFDLRELKARIEALLRRSRLSFPEAPPTRLNVGSLSLDLRTFKVSAEGKTELLTPTQFDLLYHLMSYAGEVFSTDRLLQEVWGYHPGTSNPALVRWHIKNLREKIEPSPTNPIYILTIPRHGYTIPQL